ncbi:MAG TPA: DUF1697 domain-containing protein [Fimbriimonadaceae bacterium]|nr:DUF1697 domain-containing protein [Fimbriimonadaceae bacterium]
MPSPYVALLRGINVGGKNILPMKDLAAMFVEVGCADVRTYIQSGNVVFRAESETAERAAVIVPAFILERFQIRAPVIVRDQTEIEAVIVGNPYLNEGVPPEEIGILFLGSVPASEQIEKLDPARSAPDRFEVVGRDVYMHLVTGFAKTKLTNDYFESRLKTPGTARNWRTVLKLREMLG